MTLAELFGDKDTLVAYSYMFGPERARPCPMCTSQMSAWDGEAQDIGQRVSLRDDRPLADRAAGRVQARAGVAQPAALFRRDGAYTRDYVHPEDSDMPRLQRIHAARRDDPPLLGGRDDARATRGRTARGADPMPLWQILDPTPEGRGTDWYPKLSYG